MAKRKAQAETRQSRSGANEPAALTSWIRLAQDEHPPKEEGSPGYVQVYGEDALPPVPEEPTVSKIRLVKDRKTKQIRVERSESRSERIDAHLKILWADVGFWELVVGGGEAYRLRWYIQSQHQLRLPELPAEVWLQFAKEPKLRDTLFGVLKGQAWRWSGPTQAFLPLLTTAEIFQKRFKRLTEDYLNHPELDLCAALASRHFSREALMAIKDMATRLLEDADWCLGAGDQVPEVGVRKGVGRPKQLKIAERLEKIARLLKANPASSDSAIARLFPYGRDDEAVRKSVEVARRLLKCREGKNPVER
ncbi:MAG: hypothetical protein ACLQVX_22335 [Limisphaerales bacterium]